MLGADVGSSLVVKLLSFDLSLLVPICLVAGTAMFLATEPSRLAAVRPHPGGHRAVDSVSAMIGKPLNRFAKAAPAGGRQLFLRRYVTASSLAAIITWMFHSSVAAILLLVALAGRGIVPPELGIVLVLGANLGGGIIAAMLSRAAPPESRTVPVGNLIMRGAGAIAG